MTCICLINPVSGNGQGRALGQILAGAPAAVFAGDVQEIDLNNLEEQMAGVSRNYDSVIIAGGDGTVSMLLPYLINREIKVGLIPLGTANDLAKEVGVFRLFSWRKAAALFKYYRSAPTRDLAVWKLCGGERFQQEALFCNYVSFGFDAAVVSDFADWRRQGGQGRRSGVWLNRLAYVRASLKNFSRGFIRAGSIQRDAQEVYITAQPVRAFFFSNIKSVMGFGISNPASNPFDSQVEALVVSSIWSYGGMVLRQKVGFMGGQGLGSGQIWELGSLDPGTAVQVDGEARSDLKSQQYKLQLAGQMRIMVAV